jgi:predicted aldo/keto reductase-like oxidoreductase
VDEPLSIRIVRDAIHRGINFMDNCWDYNDGASEIRMGKALRVLDFTLGTHPITTKGTSGLGGAKRRSALG